MGKIRVQDLAKMMGIPNQDLIFKLKSIGVRVEGEDAQIDSDTLQAILQGKQLPHPREVILRDEEAQATAPRQGRLARRRAPNPLRPNRPRTVIQQRSDKIRTLPSSDKKKEREEKERKEREERERKAKREAEEAAAKQAEAEAKQREAELEAQEKARAEGKKKAEATDEEAATPAKKKAKKSKKAAEDKVEGKRPRIDDEGDEDLDEDRAERQADKSKRRAERRKQRREQVQSGEAPNERSDAPVMISENMTVRDFADKLGMKAKDLITMLFRRGVIVNINHVLDTETALKLAEEMGIDAMEVTLEEEVQLTQEMAMGEEGDRAPRAPVVTVMGHVDHGKTSLLDAIRSTRVTEREHGGITQHIGAYRVESKGKGIVFVDTPGHEAFTTMRARGAKVTDIVVLVVAADDGVMPQTIEAIDHARAAGVPIVVAINKIDKANANQDRVKKELADQNLLVEDWGGDIVAVPVSAIENKGIDELLEMILLTADLLELEASPDVPAQGVVLEARKEVGRGTVATVLVQNGTLAIGDSFVSGAAWGRVRAMNDAQGERIEEAGPSTPVEVTGFSDVPEAGDVFLGVGAESKAREIAEFRQSEQRRKDLQPAAGKMSLDDLFSKIEQGEIKELPVVIKADVQGSVEVLRDTLVKLGTEKVQVEVIHASAGAVTTNDVLLASASDAIVVGFNVRPEKKAVELAEKEGVDIRLHTVIYELADEIKNAMAGLLEPTFEEVTRGRAEVREIFKVPRAGTIAGCHVVDGVIPRNANVRLLRDNVIVHDGKIGSLKRFKDDASEVRAGFDCGIGLERFQDIKPGDEIEAYVREEVAQTL